MKLTVVALLGAMVVTGCAKAPVRPVFRSSPPPAFKLRSGTLQDFADYRSVCVKASDQGGGTDLTAVAVSVLVRELPGFSNSCGEVPAALDVTLDTGHGGSPHITGIGPRFGFGHVGRRRSRGGWVAEAMVWDYTGEDNREEAIRKVATLLANFLNEARVTTQPLNPAVK